MGFILDSKPIKGVNLLIESWKFLHLLAIFETCKQSANDGTEHVGIKKFYAAKDFSLQEVDLEGKSLRENFFHLI